MVKLLSSGALVSLLGCRPDQKEVYNLYDAEPTSKVKGVYQVQYQILNGDTLWSDTGINKLGYATVETNVTYLGNNEVELTDRVSFRPETKFTTTYSYSIRTTLKLIQGSAKYSFNNLASSPASGEINSENLSLRIKSEGYDMAIFAKK
jgi:hypothetical protein